MYVTLHPNSLGQYLRKTDIESWLFNFIFHSHNKYCVEHGEFNNSNQLQNSSIETKMLVLCRLSLVQLTPLLLRIFLGSTANSGVRGIVSEMCRQNLIGVVPSLKITQYKIGLLWCHSHVELRLIEVEVWLKLRLIEVEVN